MSVGIISCCLLAVPMPGIGDAPSGNELLKPADAPVAKKPHQVTYKLSDGSDKWDQTARDRITKAMDEAVAVYNKYGDFDKVLTANWNPGTPTADANFGGWINFGGQIGTRTALHEIAHTLGIGTAPKWRNFSVNGKWTGKYGIEQLKELDGPDAVLHCDRQHFWPYGLNYYNEGGKDAFRRNVLMVTAMRADMGLGPPPHPAANALAAARVDATAAHTALDKAKADLNVLQNKIKSGIDSRPEVLSAAATAASSKAAYDAAVSTELTRVHVSADYLTAKNTADAARAKLEQLHREANADSQIVASTASDELNARSQMTGIESKALSSSKSVTDANKTYQAAEQALEETREAPSKQDPAMITAKSLVESARVKADSADKAVITAEAAAKKEAADSPPSSK